MTRREEGGQNRFLVEPVRPVFITLAALVLDDLALGVEFILIQCRGKERQPLGLEIERPLEEVAGHDLEIDRHVLVRERVRRGPGLLQRNIVVRHGLGAAEHHVLEEVRESGPPRLLVLGPDVVSHSDSHAGYDRVAMQRDLQAVGQGVRLESELRRLWRFGVGGGGEGGQQQRQDNRSKSTHGVVLGAKFERVQAECRPVT